MSHRTLLRPVRTAAALTLAAAAAFGLTACDNSVGGADAAGHASSASASSTSGGQANADGRASDDAKPGESATTGGSAGGSGTSGGGATVARGAARAAGSQDTSGDRCSADALRLELGQADTGAGNIRYPLSFTNTGRKSCTLRGYPGIALLAKDGSAIGHPADREGSAGSAVTLAPGGSAHTVLHTINEGLKDGGCWKDASLVQVYAPGSKTRMTARAAEGLRVCGNEFLVSALESGSGS